MAEARERWRAVVGQEGCYEVSDLGSVRSLDRRVSCGKSDRFAKGVPLQQAHAKTGGYPVVNLGGKVRKVHILVLEAFVGARPAGDIHGRHLNDNVCDNRLCNLAWGTRSENFHDAVRNGKHVNAGKRFCKAGHEFTPENTKPNTSGGRSCRECANRRNREYDHRVREASA